MNNYVDQNEINIFFNDNLLNEMDKKFTLLPDDLKRKIYMDYFKAGIDIQDLCNNLIEILQSSSCQRLEIELVVPILTKILDDKLAIEYLYNNYCYTEKHYSKNIFKLLYDQLVINKKKNFVNLSLVDDFALSWLFYMYH